MILTEDKRNVEGLVKGIRVHHEWNCVKGIVVAVGRRSGYADPVTGDIGIAPSCAQRQPVPRACVGPGRSTGPHLKVLQIIAMPSRTGEFERVSGSNESRSIRQWWFSFPAWRIRVSGLLKF